MAREPFHHLELSIFHDRNFKIIKQKKKEKEYMANAYHQRGLECFIDITIYNRSKNWELFFPHSYISYHWQNDI